MPETIWDKKMTNIPEKVRQIVWDRAQGMCEAEIEAFVPFVGTVKSRCCSTYGLTPHHKQYRSRGGKNTPGNLILVCRKCHDVIQFGTKEKWAKKYRISGF